MYEPTSWYFGQFIRSGNCKDKVPPPPDLLALGTKIQWEQLGGKREGDQEGQERGQGRAGRPAAGG